MHALILAALLLAPLPASDDPAGATSLRVRIPARQVQALAQRLHQEGFDVLQTGQATIDLVVRPSELELLTDRGGGRGSALRGDRDRRGR